MNRKIEGLLKSDGIGSLREAVDDSSVRSVEVSGLYSSAKAFAISEAVKKGVHLVVLADKEGAAGCVNDLYNIKGDEHVYFFPPSDVRTVKGTMKDMSAKVQRTAAVSALEDYSDGRYKGDYLIIVGYKESVEENIPDRNQIEDAVLRVSKGAAFPFEKLQDEETGLYLESSDYIYDLFKDEVNFGHIVQAEI